MNFEGAPLNNEQPVEAEAEAVEEAPARKEFSTVEVLRTLPGMENVKDEEADTKWNSMSDEEKAKAILNWESSQGIEE